MGRLLEASMAGASSEEQRRELQAMVGTMRASYSGGGSGGSGGGGGSGVVVAHAAAEEETGEDAALWSRYEIIRSSIASQLLSGMSQVSSDTYAERDDLLHQLSDEALQREYVQQSEAYLDQGTPPALRGMSEMLLIKLGELMTKPRHVRIAMGQRAREARATAATNASLSASVGEPAIMWKREAEWNRQAYDSLRAALTATLQAPDAPAHAELFKRLCNRHELRLILMTQQEASRLMHSEQQAWGTSGLKPIELRSILHAISHVLVLNGRPALQFKEQLKAKVRELPPPEEGELKVRNGGGGGLLRL